MSRFGSTTNSRLAMIAGVILATFAGSAPAAEAWTLYDDFSGPTLDTSKWSTGDLINSAPADVTAGQLRLSWTEPLVADEDSPTAVPIDTAGVTGVKSDIELLSTSTGNRAMCRMSVRVGSWHYKAEIKLSRYYGQSGAYISADFQDILDESDSGCADLGIEPALFDHAYNVAITVANDRVDYFVDGTLYATYSGQGGILSGNYSLVGIEFVGSTDSRDNPERFVDARVDNVYVTPEPATLSLLVLGGLGMLLRRKRGA